MNLTLLAFLVATCFTAAFASTSCTPDQWEGFEGVIGGYDFRHRTGLIKEALSIHYDFKNLRSAIFLDYVNQDRERKFQVVVHGKKDGGVHLYVVDLKEGSCWIKKFDTPFRRICIPEGAKHEADFYIGLDKLKVSSYSYSKDQVTSQFSVSMVGDDIIPIGEIVYGSLGKAYSHVGFLESVGFGNITPGIKNETVFKTPPQCEAMEDISMLEQFTRQHYILGL